MLRVNGAIVPYFAITYTCKVVKLVAYSISLVSMGIHVYSMRHNFVLLRATASTGSAVLRI